MRKIILLAVVSCFLIGDTHAQVKKDVVKTNVPEEDTVAPYKKYPKLPAFNVLMMDSTTIFNTYNIPAGHPIALVFFSPDCGHCHRTTQRIVDSMDMLKNIRFYFITPVHSMEELRNFVEKFHLDKYENVVLVGRDYEFFAGSYYKTRIVPDIALYDEHKMLIKLIEGETYAQTIYDVVH